MPVSIDLRAAAHLEMVREGFEPDFPADVVREVGALPASGAIQPSVDSSRRDLRDLAWSSIDNPESRDLDQVEVAELLPNGDIKVLVGVADVDSLVVAGSAVDRARCAQHDVGLLRRRHVSDAARAALDGPHVAERRR